MQGSILTNSVLGCNAFIDNDCTIENSLIMGNDTYTNEPSRRRLLRRQDRRNAVATLGGTAGVLLAGCRATETACDTSHLVADSRNARL